MPELNPNVSIFERHFDVFDTAAKGGKKDGIVSRQDIEAVANGAQYTPEQRAAARYLLDHPEEYALLDTGKHGGGLGEADGRISRDDVNAVIADAELFSDSATFVSDSAVIPETAGSGDYEDPAAAAAQTENAGQGGVNGEASATSQFMHFVRDHQDNPQWLQAYFRALGAEQTAQYLSNVADPNRYKDTSVEWGDEEIAAITNALQGMYESGALNDADIARMVEHWAMEDGDFNAGIAQVFAGLEGPRAQDMQNAFYRATTELALSDQNLTTRDFKFSKDATGHLSQGDRESLAAAGAYALAQTGTENQTVRLIELQSDGGDAAVDRFVTLAMANPTRVGSFDTYTYEAQQARRDDPSRPPMGAEVEYDGIAQLVNTLSIDTTYRGGPDRMLPPSPYSYDSLQSVRDVVFASAANGIDANPDQWENNTTLKDGLSSIFMADYDRMVDGAVTSNGARLDDESPFPQGFENFIQHVLFTDPPGSMRDVTSQFLIDKLSTTINDINSMPPEKFIDKYGRDQTQESHIVGEILGHIDNGMEQAVQSASDKRAAQKEALQFGLDLVWALGQDGLKLLPGGNVVSAVLPKSITDSSTYGAIKGEIISKMQQGLTDEAADLLLEEFPGLHADDTLSGLGRELSEMIQGDNSGDYLSSLLSSYENIDNNPADAS